MRTCLKSLCYVAEDAEHHNSYLEAAAWSCDFFRKFEPFVADLGETKDVELWDAVLDLVYRSWWDKKVANDFVQDLVRSRASASLMDTVVGYGALTYRP